MRHIVLGLLVALTLPTLAHAQAQPPSPAPAPSPAPVVEQPPAPVVAPVSPPVATPSVSPAAAPSPPPAIAQPPAQEGKAYLTAKVGGVIPKSSDLEGFDNGLSLEAALGYRVNENFALEFGVGHFSMSGAQTGYVSGVFATVKADVTAYSVTGAVRLVLPVDKLELYGLAGGGLYPITERGELSAPGYTTATNSASDTPFGFFLGGGLNVKLSPSARLGAEVKYVIGKVTLFNTDSEFNSIIVAVGLTFSL